MSTSLTAPRAHVNPCLDDETVAAMVEGALSPAALRGAEAHLAGCAACRALVSDLADSVAVRASPASGNPWDLAGATSSYELGREIARGGMGRILEAWDRRQERRVAIKMLIKPGAVALRRFRREARITARLQHPAIVPLYEAAVWETGEPFFAMRLVRGRPLDEVIGDAETIRERLSLLSNVAAIADALAYAHEQGVVHRDLKPSNVLVGAFGETVVIDWGLAKELHEGETRAAHPDTPRAGASEGMIPVDGSSSDAALTEAGRVVGTVAYMSPEQASGGVVDERTDVFALGAVLYHLLTGQAPFGRGGTSGELARVAAAAEVPIGQLAPDAPPELVTIAQKAMARDPRDRYPNAKELAAELRRFADGQLVSAHLYTLSALARRWVSRHRTFVAMAAALVLAVGLTAGVGIRRIVRERDRADALKVEADRQRGTAVTQRDAAERLVGFVIGELRDRLDALGKLALLAGIGREVEGYYGAISVGDADPGALRQRADALDVLAGVDFERHDFASAESLLRDEIGIREAAGARDPSDLPARVASVNARTMLARTLDAAGRPEEAGVEGERASDAGAALVASAPGDQHALIAAAFARAWLGNARGMHGDQDATRRCAIEARELLGRVADSGSLDWEWQDRLAGAFGAVGQAGMITEDWSLAEEGFGHHNVLRRALLAGRPDHLRISKRLAWGVRSYAFAEENVGAFEAAIADYREAKVLRAAVIAREPDDVDVIYDQGVSLAQLCDLERPWHGPAAASPTCADAVALASEVVAAHADDTRAHDGLARAERAAGRLYLAEGRTEDARRSFADAVVHARRALERAPTSPHFKNGMVDGLRGVALAELELGRLEPARADLAEAMTIVEGRLSEAPSHALFRWDRAMLTMALAAVDQKEADLGAARDEYGRAIADLDKVVADDSRDADSVASLAEAELSLAALSSGTARAAHVARADSVLQPLVAGGRLSPEASARIKALRRP